MMIMSSFDFRKRSIQDGEEEQGIPSPEDLPAPEFRKDDTVHEVSKAFSS